MREANVSKAVQLRAESKGEAREFRFKVGASFKRECPRITIPQNMYPFLASIHCRHNTPVIIICPNEDRCNGILSLYSNSQTYFQLRIPRTSYESAQYLRALPVGQSVILRVSRSASSIVVNVLLEEASKQEKMEK